MQNLKSLLKLNPEFQDLISDGKITATTGFKLLSKLSADDQVTLFKQLDATKSYTAAMIQSEIAKIAKPELDCAKERDQAVKEKQTAEKLKTAAIQNAQEARAAAERTATLLKTKEAEADDLKQKLKEQHSNVEELTAKMKEMTSQSQDEHDRIWKEGYEEAKKSLTEELMRKQEEAAAKKNAELEDDKSYELPPFKPGARSDCIGMVEVNLGTLVKTVSRIRGECTYDEIRRAPADAKMNIVRYAGAIK